MKYAFDENPNVKCFLVLVSPRSPSAVNAKNDDLMRILSKFETIFEAVFHVPMDIPMGLMIVTRLRSGKQNGSSGDAFFKDVGLLTR